MSVAGLLLAGGAGTRMGRPKALVRDPDGRPWLDRAVSVLREGGCAEVLVVLGARAEEARPLVPDGVSVTVARDWADGLSATLRAGLDHLGSPASHGPEAALVLLVDLPDLVPEVVARLLPGTTAATLARAAYGGTPGHPVVLGRDHWSGVAAAAVGDDGAKPYLRTRADRVRLVECGDLATGEDQDRPTTVVDLGSAE